jgi:hypothetical protein
VTTLVCTAIVVPILVIEYRAMIIVLFALLPIAILYGDLLRLRQTLRERFLELSWSRDGLVVETAEGRSDVPWSEIVVRVTPRLLVVARRLPQPHRFRVWTLPGEEAALRAAGDALSSLGVPVARERGVTATTAFVLGSFVLWRVAAVVASAMVIVGVANLGLALMNRGGSLTYGALLIVGALVPMTIVVLVRGYFIEKAGPSKRSGRS